MFCKKCGNKIEDGSKFRIHCGNNVLSTDNTAAPTTTPTPERAVISGYEGLGGWLAIVGLGLFVRLFYLLKLVYTDASYFNDGTVDSVSSLVQGYSGALGFELLMGIGLSVAVIYLMYLYFKKKKNFPKYFIYYLIADVVFGLLGYFIVSSLAVYSDEARKVIADILSEQASTLFTAAISAVIWILYMKKSKRVKNTFVND